MPVKNLSYRLSLRGGQQFREGMDRVGDTGQQAMDRIANAGDRTTQTLLSIDRGVNRTGKAMQDMADRMRRVEAGLGAVAGVAGAARVAGALGLATDNALRSADAVNRLAERTGVARETIQEARFAVRSLGGETDQLSDGLTELTSRLGEARAGAGPLVTGLQELDAGLLETLRTTEDADGAFRAIISRLGEYDSATRASAVASAAFGEEAAPVVVELAGRFDELSAKARAAGSVMSNDLLRQAGETREEMDALGAQIGDAFNTGLVRGFTSEFERMKQVAGDTEVQENISELGFVLGRAEQRAIRWGAQTVDAIQDVGEAISTFRENTGLDSIADAAPNVEGFQTESMLPDPEGRIKEFRQELERVREGLERIDEAAAENGGEIPQRFENSAESLKARRQELEANIEATQVLATASCGAGDAIAERIAG